jgi:hypothetical protein
MQWTHGTAPESTSLTGGPTTVPSTTFSAMNPNASPAGPAFP